MVLRKSIKEESEIYQSEFSDNFEGLKLLKNIVIFFRGLYGKVKVIQNLVGGYVILILLCGRFLLVLFVFKLFLKLLITLVEGQI